LIFSFLGFLGSRLLLCCPLAMSISLGFMTTQITYTRPRTLELIKLRRRGVHIRAWEAQ
jgi:hypothetical protein